jgi:hypothetical protein
MKKSKTHEILSAKQLIEYLQLDEVLYITLQKKRKIPPIKILG